MHQCFEYLENLNGYWSVISCIIWHYERVYALWFVNRCEHRGSYMSAHVLLTLLNEMRKRDQMRGLPIGQENES